MEEYLREECLKYELSDDDIYEYFENIGKKTNTNILITTYDVLAEYKTLEQIFRDFECVILLYPTESLYVGHWVIMFKSVEPGTIEYFDPYGMAPDFIFGLPSTLIKMPHYLTEIIINSKHKLIYNTFAFQKLDNHIKTCGRWIILRYRLRKVFLGNFIKLFKKSHYLLSRDELICALTLL